MSDSSITIAVKRYNYANARAKANEILDFLISQDIIESGCSDSCAFGTDEGYAISEGAKLIVESPPLLPFGLVTNGLEVSLEREVFGRFPDEIICPECHENIAEEELHLDEWKQDLSNNMLCPKCRKESQISMYKFTPEWTFTNLSFTFWNWPKFKSEFIDELKRRLECEIAVFHDRL